MPPARMNISEEHYDLQISSIELDNRYEQFLNNMIVYYSKNTLETSSYNEVQENVRHTFVKV